MAGVLILIGFIVAGVLTGLNVEIPYSYSQYIAVAILACLDSVFGAFAANIDKKFRMNIFLSGFFGNALIAMLLVYIGNKLNVDIYLGAVIVFSGRLLNNFATIRREFILGLESKKIDSVKQKKSLKMENKKENKENNTSKIQQNQKSIKDIDVKQKKESEIEVATKNIVSKKELKTNTNTNKKN